MEIKLDSTGKNAQGNKKNKNSTHQGLTYQELTYQEIDLLRFGSTRDDLPRFGLLRDDYCILISLMCKYSRSTVFDNISLSHANEISIANLCM